MRKKVKISVAGIMAAVGMIMGSLSPAEASSVPLVNGEFSYFNYVVPGDGGYYLLCGNLVGYWDGVKEHRARPLCGRPDCGHNNSDCMAYVPILHSRKLFLVKDSLYVVGQAEYDNVTKSEAFPLWKIAKDGSAKEIALYAEEMPLQYTIFKEKFYYSFLKEEDGKTVASVWCQSLNGKDKKEIWKSALQQGEIISMQGIGEELYFQEKGFDKTIDLNDPSLDFEKIQEESNLYAYNPQADSWKTNPLDNKEEGKFTHIRNIYDGNMYYSYDKEGTLTLWSKPVDGEGDPRMVGILPKYPDTADEDYVYAYCRRDTEKQSSGFKIYDHDGKVIQEISFPDMNTNLDVFPLTKEYVFGYMTKYLEEKCITEHAVVLLDKEEMAKGQAEIVPVFETECN
ncbi:MAG: hypothetical protein UFJ18_02565 [Blautia sp.]|nr:hypothetical protein [Blautia sp.]